MILYGVITTKNEAVLKVVKEANERFNLKNENNNPALIFIDGKIKVFPYKKSSYLIIFLMRNFLINFRGIKYLNNYAFKKSLKKAGYIGVKPYFINNNDLYKKLKVIL